MGGSGGGYFSGDTSAEDLARKTREAEAETQGAAYQSEVAGYLAGELAQFNDRDVDATQAVFAAVQKDLEHEETIEGSTELLFGGSISKHTYVDGISDVDALMVFKAGDVEDRTPDQIKTTLAEILTARYGAEAVQVGQLAVTLTRNESEVQILPAIRSGDGFKIANNDGSGWSKINPQRFASALTKANQAAGGKLVPCIKLAKAIVANLPEKQRVSGYHLESLAIKAFRGYDGEKVPRTMLRHLFEMASTHVRQPIADSSGQSVHVDDYMGAANSLKRRLASDALGRVARRIKNADGAQSLSRWQELFE